MVEPKTSTRKNPFFKGYRDALRADLDDVPFETVYPPPSAFDRGLTAIILVAGLVLLGYWLWGAHSGVR